MEGVACLIIYDYDIAPTLRLTMCIQLSIFFNFHRCPYCFQNVLHHCPGLCKQSRGIGTNILEILGQWYKVKKKGQTHNWAANLEQWYSIRKEEVAWFYVLSQSSVLLHLTANLVLVHFHEILKFTSSESHGSRMALFRMNGSSQTIC